MNLQLIDHIAEMQARGCFLSAYDAAIDGLERNGADMALRHAAVLNLARAGARTSALRLVEQWNCIESGDKEMAGLYPRLLKDLALEDRQPSHALAAAQAYEELWAREGSPWYGVNTAAMYLLAGNPAASRAIAKSISKLDDEGDYWSAATLAEASLGGPSRRPAGREHLTGSPWDRDRRRAASPCPGRCRRRQSLPPAFVTKSTKPPESFSL
jgi:predicted Zn-dependent protease